MGLKPAAPASAGRGEKEPTKGDWPGPGEKAPLGPGDIAWKGDIWSPPKGVAEPRPCAAGVAAPS